MNSSELYDTFRSDVVDVAKPYLWSDAEVWRYADAAYKMFVRLTGGIADFTSDATILDVVAGERVATSNPSILRFLSAELASNNHPVRILNMNDMNPSTTSDYGVTRSLLSDRSIGEVHSMIIGRQRNTVEFVSTPAAGDTINLSVFRLPLCNITDFGQEIEEVDEDHHIYLIDWMKHLAYRKQDADTFDKAKSEECGATFVTYCELVKAAHERAAYKPRTVQYGGY